MRIRILNVHEIILFTNRERDIFVNKCVFMQLEILLQAIEKINLLPDLQAVYNYTEKLKGNLEITCNGQKQVFTVSIKQELRFHQLQQIEEDYNRNKNLMVVAAHIFPKIKEELRAKGIPYLEANGNIFIRNNQVYLLVDIHKPIQLDKTKGNRAFTKTGLKVLLYLLQHKEALSLTQRELAEQTLVGLGNIPQILEGLKETNYLIPLNNKTYTWNNKEQLLEKWVAEYATVLRPKLIKERYTLKNDWRQIQLFATKTVWGGEPAADILTNFLRPEKFVVYSKENRTDLIRNYNFIPDKQGEIEVLDLFWKHLDRNVAPPLLIYAELLFEGGKRNKETAQKIYDEFIQPNL